ncbi:MAG: hypothetical protein ACXVHN_07605 [Methanobacterium sp.]
MADKLVTGYLIKLDDMSYEVCITKHTKDERFEKIKKAYTDNYASLTGLVGSPNVEVTVQIISVIF